MRQLIITTAENEVVANQRPKEIMKVTTQPQTLVLNKYLGFKQLSYIKEKGFSCIIPIEIDINGKDILLCAPTNKLWSVRVATIIGKDYDLPSIIGVDKFTAIKWINEQSNNNSNFVFFVSEYFKPKISGRIHIEYFNTKIEMSLGDFSAFKHSIPDLSIISDFNQFFVRKIDKQLIDSSSINRAINLSKGLKLLYKEEFISEHNLLHEYDFAFIPKDETLDLQILGMRAYVEKNKQYNKISSDLLNYLCESLKDELFKL